MVCTFERVRERASARACFLLFLFRFGCKLFEIKNKQDQLFGRVSFLKLLNSFVGCLHRNSSSSEIALCEHFVFVLCCWAVSAVRIALINNVQASGTYILYACGAIRTRRCAKWCTNTFCWAIGNGAGDGRMRDILVKINLLWCMNICSVGSSPLHCTYEMKNERKTNFVGVAMRMRSAFNCLHDVHHLNYAPVQTQLTTKSSIMVE